MSDNEPLRVAEDSRRLIESLEETGELAGRLVSKAAVEYGHFDPRTTAFDDVVQHITAVLLEFHVALERLNASGHAD